MSNEISFILSLIAIALIAYLVALNVKKIILKKNEQGGNEDGGMLNDKIVKQSTDDRSSKLNYEVGFTSVDFGFVVGLRFGIGFAIGFFIGSFILWTISILIFGPIIAGLVGSFLSSIL